MSEHSELIEKLDRIEIKIDLLIKASGFRIIRCEDIYHQIKWQGRECPSCKAFDRTLVIVPVVEKD